MSKSHSAFTIIELVFAIAIIGILSAIAVPKFAATRDDAIIARARSTVGALRSAIASERQKNILKGNFDDISGSTAASLLDYGLSDDWSRSGNIFRFTAPDGSTCDFNLTNNKLIEIKSTCGVSGMSDL